MLSRGAKFPFWQSVMQIVLYEGLIQIIDGLLWRVNRENDCFQLLSDEY